MLTPEEYNRFEESRRNINNTIESLYSIVKTLCEELFKSKYVVMYKYIYNHNSIESFMSPLNGGNYFVSLDMNMENYSMEIGIYHHTSGVKLSPPKLVFTIYEFNEKTREQVRNEIRNSILLSFKKEKENE